ncbi:MAG: AAA family ATPase [Sulfurovum sp.]|nr:AAA family ATPase [Sulfurovum sp.]
MNTHLNIEHIKIEELFGIYNYSIPMENIDISKLLILYGDNGAGKTTILEILFNLLSYEDDKGHKTKLSNTKFKKITIKLSNKIEVSAYRKNKIIGDYYLTFDDQNNKKLDVLCHTIRENEEYIIRDGNKGSDLVNNFLEKLKTLNFSIHYISDDRKIKSNIRMILDEKNDEIEILENYLDRGRLRNTTFSLNDIFLKSAIGRVEKWFKLQVSLADNMGQTEIQDIYFNLITGLLEDTPKILSNDETFFNKDEILLRLEKLEKKNQDFIKYTLRTKT